MSEIARFDMFADDCVGRDIERESFAEFIEHSSVRLGVDVCIVRGLGGIGKTTLAHALANDFLGQGDSRSVLGIDCVTLPARPDMASLLRAFDSEADGISSLRMAASRLDRVASMVRAASPPSDSDPATVGGWLEMRRLALELLAFFSSAAVETLTFGQLGSSANNAVLAGVQAIASARSAMAEIVSSLSQQDRIRADDAAIALDPESYIIAALAEFLRQLTADDGVKHLLLVVDKSENLLDSLPRFMAILEGAALQADFRMSCILAGRIVQVTAADGSDLDVREFLRVASPSSLDIDLTPFSVRQVRTLLQVTHQRLHADPEFADVPQWLVETVTAMTNGLPLWAASIAEAIFAAGPRPWENSDASIRRLLTDEFDLATTVARIFRDARIDEHTSAMPLLVALTLAPGDLPSADICRAAEVPSDALSHLQRRYSFMRGDRLHDTARAILRHFLCTSADTRLVVTQVAARLREEMDRSAPPGSPLMHEGSWTEHLRRVAELDFWLGVDRGILTTVDYVLMGIPVGSPWIGVVIEQAAWFVERTPPSASSRQLLTACVRAAYPVVLAHALASDDSDPRSVATRSAVMEAAQSGADFHASFGRYLDEIDRMLDASTAPISAQGLIGFDGARLLWLVLHGFDDDARNLALDLAERIKDTPDGTRIRLHIGRSMLRLIHTHVSWGEAAKDEARDARLAQVDGLINAITLVSPRDAAGAIRIAIEAFGPRLATTTALAQILALRKRLPEDPNFLYELGQTLLELGRFEEAEYLYREGLARTPDWIGGALGRGEALLAVGRVADACEFLSAQLRAARANAKLSSHGRARCAQLATVTIIALISAGREEDALAVVGAGETNSYGRMLSMLFGTDDWAAYEAVETEIANGERQTQFACEAAIALARCGRQDEARAAFDRWSSTSRPASERAMDGLLLEAARRAGWLDETAWQGLPSGELE
jgi:tetratricopeptide (TPR) repeat protein